MKENKYNIGDEVVVGLYKSTYDNRYSIKTYNMYVHDWKKYCDLKATIIGLPNGKGYERNYDYAIYIPTVLVNHKTNKILPKSVKIPNQKIKFGAIDRKNFQIPSEYKSGLFISSRYMKPAEKSFKKCVWCFDQVVFEKLLSRI